MPASFIGRVKVRILSLNSRLQLNAGWYLTHVGKSMQESKVRYYSPSVSSLLRLYMCVHVVILPASLLFSIKMALGSGYTGSYVS